MFLRNYDNYFIALNLCAPYSTQYPQFASGDGGKGSIAGFEDGYYNQRGSNGTISTIITNTSSSSYMAPPMMLEVATICLGTGTTKVTYDDYRLSGEVVPNVLAHISRNTTFDKETLKWKKTLTATYSNTTDTRITISEWGLWRYNSTSWGSSVAFSNSSSVSVLTFREVLDEPIVIEPGTTATLTFSVEIPMPNHP